MSLGAAGKHIICEKLFARSMEEASSLVQAAESAGVRIAVHQPTRWYHPSALAQRLVRQGYTGEPFCFIDDRCHALDYANPIDDVHFKGVTRPGPIHDLDGKRDFADLGDRLIDFQPVAETLKTIGYDGWLIGDNDFSNSPIESARKVLGRIRTLMS